MRGDQAAPGTRPAWRIALAAGIYLALTLWTVRALLPSPSTLSTLRVGRAPNAISNADLAVMVWSTNRNARTLVTHPWRLPDFETCYPTARPTLVGPPGRNRSIGSGEEVRRTLRLAVPATPGGYRVTLARAAAPADVVAVAQVTVDIAP